MSCLGNRHISGLIILSRSQRTKIYATTFICASHGISWSRFIYRWKDYQPWQPQPFQISERNSSVPWGTPFFGHPHIGLIICFHTIIVGWFMITLTIVAHSTIVVHWLIINLYFATLYPLYTRWQLCTSWSQAHLQISTILSQVRYPHCWVV